jgi:hypothetical protein
MKTLKHFIALALVSTATVTAALTPAEHAKWEFVQQCMPDKELLKPTTRKAEKIGALVGGIIGSLVTPTILILQHKYKGSGTKSMWHELNDGDTATIVATIIGTTVIPLAVTSLGTGLTWLGCLYPRHRAAQKRRAAIEATIEQLLEAGSDKLPASINALLADYQKNSDIEKFISRAQLLIDAVPLLEAC